MDALALLCTLYADGPSTLQRLRSGGCDSLSGLLESDREGLQARLGWDARLSERFLREAWILAERLDVGWSDEENVDVSSEPQAPPSSRESSSTAKGNSSSSLREKLLSRWRDLDREEPPQDPGMDPAHARSSDSPEALGLREPVLNRERDARALDPGLLALGFSAPQLSRLKAKGIESRAALIGTDTFELASVLGLPYTRAQRQQLLAKRVEQEQVQPANNSREELVPPSPVVPHAPADSPASQNPPASTHHRLDAAGPFA